MSGFYQSFSRSCVQKCKINTGKVLNNAFLMFFFQNRHLMPSLMPASCVTPYKQTKVQNMKVEIKPAHPAGLGPRLCARTRIAALENGRRRSCRPGSWSLHRLRSSCDFGFDLISKTVHGQLQSKSCRSLRGPQELRPEGRDLPGDDSCPFLVDSASRRNSGAPSWLNGFAVDTGCDRQKSPAWLATIAIADGTNHLIMVLEKASASDEEQEGLLPGSGSIQKREGRRTATGSLDQDPQGETDTITQSEI